MTKVKLRVHENTPHNGMRLSSDCRIHSSLFISLCIKKKVCSPPRFPTCIGRRRSPLISPTDSGTILIRLSLPFHINSSQSISSSGRHCTNVSATLMPVLRQSVCCRHRTKRMCDVRISPFVLAFLCYFPCYHSLHKCQFAGLEIRGSNGSKCYHVFSFATGMLKW